MAAIIRTCPSCGRKNRVKAADISATVRCGSCKTTLSATIEPIDADAELFDEVVRSARVPVLVDFWAAWCGPCRMAAPEVSRVAETMAGRAVVLKVDTDRYPDVANRFGVRGIPNFVVLRGGRVIKQQSGVVGHDQLKRWLEEAA